MFAIFGLTSLSVFNLTVAQSDPSPYNTPLNLVVSDPSLESVVISDAVTDKT